MTSTCAAPGGVGLRRRAIIATVIAAGLLLGTGTPVRAQSSFASAMDAIARDVLAPGYAAFAAAAADLHGTIDDGCADPAGGPDGPAQKAAFHAAFDAWSALEWADVGQRRADLVASRLHYWPDTRNTVGRHLASALTEQRTDLLAPGGLAEASVALQGFPALERLIFDPPAEGDATFRCVLAAAIAANVADIARGLSTAWPAGGDPRAAWTAAFGHQDDAVALGEIYQAVYETLDLIGRRKLFGPMGASAAEARARRGEMWRSDRAMRNIRLDLEAIRGLAAQETGFGGLMEENGIPEIRNGLVSRLDGAIALAAAHDVPLEGLLANAGARGDLETLMRLVDEVRESWARDVGPGLGLTIGFNAMDGD